MPVKSYRTVQPLRAGARIALVAPSGPLVKSTYLDDAVANVTVFGWEPVVGEHVTKKEGYLAGSDDQRLHDLNTALRDPRIDAVWCLRGGYGASRIIERIDYEAFQRHPKPVIGYSDITALHAALGVRCETVTYHAPTAREEITPFSRHSFERALIQVTDPCGLADATVTIRDGRVTGRLAGGNLAVLCSLMGTPYFPDLRDAILILEDINEDLYKVDRMLNQLLLAGVLENVAGLAIGHFTGIWASDTSPEERQELEAGARTLEILLHEIANRLNIPCVVGLPIGHISEQWTIPLGALATLDAGATRLTVHLGDK